MNSINKRALSKACSAFRVGGFHHLRLPHLRLSLLHSCDQWSAWSQSFIFKLNVPRWSVSICAVLGLERPVLSFREGLFYENRSKKAAIPRDRCQEGQLGDACLSSPLSTGLARESD
jgi:hypothetical protein